MIVDPKEIPLVVKNKLLLIDVLTKMRDVPALRALRDKSTDIKIGLYHHSEGTLSFYNDQEKRYYTEQQIIKAADESLKKGEWLINVVIPYKANVVFTSGSANLMKNN